MNERARFWLLAMLPLVLLGALLLAFWQLDPAAMLRGDVPPVEALVFERVSLSEEGFEAVVLNDGPDPVTIAQVQVDEAFWAFEMTPVDRTIDHLERGKLDIPYPWVTGEAHELRLLSSTGATFDHSIEVAMATPRPNRRTLGLFALIGIYVGVLPVALGLLWYPMVRRLGERGLSFVLALTVGLLLFLLVDSLHEGMEAASEVASSLQGTALLAFSALFAFLIIEAVGRLVQGARTAVSGWPTAMLVAIGIGLHNLGEGLAIGAAFGLGKMALGTLLIVGFMLHNTTEGLAIVAPLAKERVALGRLLLLGLIAGVPTIFGAWLGGFSYSLFWSVLFLGIGAGAIAQVVVQIGLSMLKGKSVRTELHSAPITGGLIVGVLVMYATGLLVG